VVTLIPMKQLTGSLEFREKNFKSTIKVNLIAWLSLV
jgi:hypothetical protein